MLIKKYALIIVLTFYRLSIMSGINAYLYYKNKDKKEKAIKYLDSLKKTIDDLKTVTVNPHLEGHLLKSAKQQELTQIGLKYEQLEANEENTLALAREWADTLYKKVERLTVILFALLPLLGLGAIYSNFPTIFMILFISNSLFVLTLIHCSRRQSLFKRIVICVLLILVYFMRLLH